MKRLFFAGYFLALIFVPAHLQALDIPRPRGFVNDFAPVLSSVEAQKLESLLVTLENKTGIEFTVVTLKSLEGEQIDDLAVKLFESWGIGKKGRDEGLLILAAIDDRKARIEVGYGLEGIINDALAGRVLREVIFPRFKAGAYGEGIIQGALVLSGIIAEAKQIELEGVPRIAKRAGPKPQPAGPISWIFRILLLIGAALLFIKNPFLFLLIFGGGFGRGFGGGFGRSSGFGGFGGGLSGGGGASGSW